MWLLQVAIKKIPGAFDDLVDAKRIVREIRLLRHFNHENVMKVVDILPPSSLEDFDVSEPPRSLALRQRQTHVDFALFCWRQS